MIKVQDFLLTQDIDVGIFTLVHYEGKVEPTYFSKYRIEGKTWFLESPCEVRKITNIEGDISKFCIDYVKTNYSIKGGKKGIIDYSKKYIEPLVINNTLYEVENYQCSPYLPEYVDKIEVVSERDCLLYILKNN